MDHGGAHGHHSTEPETAMGDHHMGDHNMDGHSMSGHAMVFENSLTATVLFSGFSTSAGVPYSVLCLVCFLAGILAVVLKLARSRMEMKLPTIDEKFQKNCTKIILSNCCRAIAVFIILTWDYFLMLAAMTFNVGIFLSIISGVAAGFLLIGHKFFMPPRDAEQVVCCYPNNADVACSTQAETQCVEHRSPRLLKDSTKAGLLNVQESQNVCCCTV